MNENKVLELINNNEYINKIRNNNNFLEKTFSVTVYRKTN